jgi:transcription elongation factor Elf1
MACTNCGSDNLVSIDLSLQGAAVTFLHCRRCEHRWWTETGEGKAVTLASILRRSAA